jgi:starch synthase
MVCAEYAPLAKVGGLGDVTAGLSNWLAERGHQVVVVLPYYGLMAEQGIVPASEPVVGPIGAGVTRYAVHRLNGTGADGPHIYLVDAPQAFGRDVYASGDAEAVRFLVLSRAALELCEAAGFEPEIVHCHDWHASPAAVLLSARRQLSAIFRRSSSVLTIHNIGYQGVFTPAVLAAGGVSGSPADFVDPVAQHVNFLRAGILHADALTTVSPTHAREIQTPEYGKGLDDLLRQRRHRLAGILNGVEYRHWSPETDGYLDVPYSAADPTGKQATRAALTHQLGLDAGAGVAIVGLVSRFVEQKGIDLIIAALPALLRERRFVCAFLGNGDALYVDALAEIAAMFPGRVVHRDAHDEALAHRILAGSDIVLVPSRYEPCGLTQMYAMRYGTVPVVRATGGLADTVVHFDPATGQGTGSVFRDADVGGVSWGLATALDWYADRGLWSRIMRNGMVLDFSWDNQGPQYLALYSRLGG